MTNDMTSGKILKPMLKFAIPVFVGNLFQQLYSMVDTIIVGRYVGVDALAAVGLTGCITFMVIGWISGMTSGFGILLSQSFGAGDHKLLRHYTAMSVYLNIAMGILMTAGLLLLNKPILQLIHTPEEIMGETSIYIGIIYAGLFATIAYNMLSAALRALGDSKTPLYFLLLSSGLNVVLDIVLIRSFHMGVAGAAIATVVSQLVSAVLCFLYMKKKYRILAFGKEDAQFSWKSFKNMMGMGVPMALQFSITGIGTVIVQGALNPFGALYIASFSASIKLSNLVTQTASALGVTMATFVGQNHGAGKMLRIKKGVRIGVIIALTAGTVSGILVFLFGQDMVKIFIAEQVEEVSALAAQYFMITAAFHPILYLIFIYRNALQGLGDGFFPMMGGVFELFARWLGVVLLVDRLGYTGICWTDPMAWVAALIPIVPVFYWRIRKLACFGKIDYNRNDF